MKELVFYGDGKACYSWKKCLQDYDRSPAIVKNQSGMSHNSFVKSLRRFLDGSGVTVVSRGGVVYLNPPVRSVSRAPSVLYYEGDWDDLVNGIKHYKEQQVVNLTDAYKRNCDFVKQLNRALEVYGVTEYEAVAVRGSCVLRRV